MKCTVLQRGKCACGETVTLAQPHTETGTILLIHTPGFGCSTIPKRSLSESQLSRLLRITLPVFTDLRAIPEGTIRLGRQGKQSPVDILRSIFERR